LERKGNTIFNENFTAHDLERYPMMTRIACFTLVIPMGENHEARCDRQRERFGNDGRNAGRKCTSRYQPQHLPSVPRRARRAAAVGVVCGSGVRFAAAVSASSTSTPVAVTVS